MCYTIQLVETGAKKNTEDKSLYLQLVRFLSAAKVPFVALIDGYPVEDKNER